MSNVYLKFTDEAQAKSVLFTEIPTVMEADGTTVTQATMSPNYLNIDTIGTIHKSTGTLKEEGSLLMIPIDGWHVNVFVLPNEDAAALEPYIVVPVNPVRVWA